MSLYYLAKHFMARKIAQFGVYFLGVVSLSDPEYLSAVGVLYQWMVDATFASDEERWYKFNTPTDCPIQIIHRIMMPQLSGCSYEVYDSVTGGILGVTPESLRRKNPEVGRVPTTEILQYTANPTGVLKVDTPIYIGEGGVTPASKPGGTNSREEGFQRYPANSVTYVRIKNTSGSSNRIVMRMAFAELDAVILKEE